MLHKTHPQPAPHLSTPLPAWRNSCRLLRLLRLLPAGGRLGWCSMPQLVAAAAGAKVQQASWGQLHGHTLQQQAAAAAM
jgi:hypothetical protein